MEEAIPSPEIFLELGARHAGRGELDQAMRCYKKARNQGVSAHLVDLGLADVYRLKAEAGKPEFYRPAEEALRRALKAAPYSAEAHDMLLLLAHKTGRLDGFVKEYGEKAKGAEKPEFFAAYLKQAGALAAMGSEIYHPYKYTPSRFVVVFFDKMLLPAATLTILASHIGPRTKPFFGLGSAMFFFYSLYRAGLYLARSKD
jgi:tetratricopeptide (TPR) repeat protein